MNTLLLPAALAGGTFWERFVSALELLFLGLGMVFSGLIMLYILLSVLNRLGKRDQVRADKHAEHAAAQAASAPAPAATDAGIAPEIAAVITAAVFAVVNQPFRIRSIRPTEPVPGYSPWAEYGRIAIHTSHRIRKG